MHPLQEDQPGAWQKVITVHFSSMTIFAKDVCRQSFQFIDCRNVVQVDADDEGRDWLHLLRGSHQHQPQEQGGHTTS